MSDQDKINADVTAIKSITEGLTTAFGNIQAEIEALKIAAASDQPLDFSGLDAAVQGLQPVANNLESIAPATPAPASTPVNEGTGQPPVPTQPTGDSGASDPGSTSST